jgi:hypothetical protein
MEVFIMAKTIMYATFESFEENELTETKEFKEFISHPRVKNNDGFITFYKEDNHQVTQNDDIFQTDWADDLENAGYYITVNDIEIEYVETVKELMEAFYEKNEIPDDLNKWAREHTNLIAINYFNDLINKIRIGELEAVFD